MNRHQRRAAAKKRPTGVPESASQAMEIVQALQGLEEFSRLAERLKPHLEQLERLTEELKEAETVMEVLQTANQELKAELALQREINIRMFAGLFAVDLDAVRNKEQELSDEISQERGSNADTDTEEA